MKQLTREWIAKAEGDFATMQREIRARKAPNFDSACFHAQQCSEKYLKARLQEAGIRFDRTHDLCRLLELALRLEPLWEALREQLRRLNKFAVAYRYPGETADRELAREAAAICKLVRAEARASLGLKR